MQQNIRCKFFLPTTKIFERSLWVVGRHLICNCPRVECNILSILSFFNSLSTILTPTTQSFEKRLWVEGGHLICNCPRLECAILPLWHSIDPPKYRKILQPNTVQYSPNYSKYNILGTALQHNIQLCGAPPLSKCISWRERDEGPRGRGNVCVRCEIWT